MRRRCLVAFVFSLLFVCRSVFGQASVGGTVRGTVTDKEFGVPVVGAAVSILGTRARVITSETGSFTIPNVSTGTYTLVFTKDGYVREVRPNVGVINGQLTDVDATMAGEFEDLDEVVVQDINVEQQEAAPIQVITPPEIVPIAIVQPMEFTLRLDSPQLLDIVGVDTISRSGAGDAAAALLLVPGATLQEGKYAVVRGLPDRYVSVLLDSVRLPVSTPGKRAVQLDQFPAAVIQSIQISKSFTPDLQGEASGGGVNVVLKDIPDEGILQIRAQYGINSQVKNGSFLTYPGGQLDFWGGNDVLQTQPDLIGQSWPNNPTGTTTGNAPPIYKWSVAAGDTWQVDDDLKVGAFGNFFYDAGASYFNNGQLNQYLQARPGTPLVPQTSQGAEPLPGDQFITQLYDVTQGTQSVQWGGMGAVGVETEQHKLGAKFIYTQLSESQAVLLIDQKGKEYFFPNYNVNDPFGPGNDGAQIDEAPWQRLETLDYSQVITEALILNGEHTLGFLGPNENEELPEPIALGTPKLDWRFALSKASDNQPDQTQFAAIWRPANGIIPPFFVIPELWTITTDLVPFSSAGWVQHINYFNEEQSIQGALNIKLPFLQWNDREGYIKTGMFVDSLSRQYRQNTFYNNQMVGKSQYFAPWSDPWSLHFPSEFHPIIQSDSDISYDGSQLIAAGYGMIDLPFNETMNLVTGVRYETTNMTTTVLPDPFALWLPPGGGNPGFIIDYPPSEYNAKINQANILPMVGVNWNIRDDLVLRTAFAQTLARPNFFELVPVLQYEFVGGPLFIGNPALQMSSLNNYDMRLDWTPEEEWLISGSVFYKQIYNPIQYVQRFAASFSYTTPVNFSSATLFGVELEGRVTAEPLFGEDFKGLATGANFTYMNSQVQLPEIDQAAFRAYGVDVPSLPMTATPDYLFNVNLTYDYDATGTQVGIFYNYQGKSLVAGASTDSGGGPPPVPGDLVPSIYQLPYGTLNFTLQQRLIYGFACSFAAKNLTNPIRETQFESFDGQTAINSSYTAGIDLSFGLSWQLIF
jgi:hypothetical protein